jgi:hypothetical protein
VSSTGRGLVHAGSAVDECGWSPLDPRDVADYLLSLACGAASLNIGGARGRNGDDAGMTTSDASGLVPTRWTKSTVYRDMWVDPDDTRETDVETVDERGTLLDHRATTASPWK